MGNVALVIETFLRSLIYLLIPRKLGRGILMLRKELQVLKRQVKKPRFTAGDRLKINCEGSNLRKQMSTHLSNFLWSAICAGTFKLGCAHPLKKEPPQSIQSLEDKKSTSLKKSEDEKSKKPAQYKANPKKVDFEEVELQPPGCGPFKM